MFRLDPPIQVCKLKSIERRFQTRSPLYSAATNTNQSMDVWLRENQQFPSMLLIIFQSHTTSLFSQLDFANILINLLKTCKKRAFSNNQKPKSPNFHHIQAWAITKADVGYYRPPDWWPMPTHSAFENWHLLLTNRDSSTALRSNIVTRKGHITNLRMTSEIHNSLWRRT